MTTIILCWILTGVGADAKPWSTGEWFHQPQGQQTLNVPSVVKPFGKRVLVRLHVPLIVEGKNACVCIPSPLHHFVDQHVVYSRVTAEVNQKPLQIGKDFHTELVVSDQGQPFFCVELTEVSGQVTIHTDSLVLLPPHQDQKRWEARIDQTRFARQLKPTRALPNFQHHEPPAPVKPALQKWVRGKIGPQTHPFAALIESVRNVHRSMTYEGTVKSEDPYAGLLDDHKGHCGIYAAGVSAVGQTLRQRHGTLVFNAGGYWGGPHVKNGVLVALEDGSPAFLFADATQPDPLGPQGQYAFVVTSIAGWNTFHGSDIPKTPKGNRPPDVPFPVNTMSIRDGRIVSWPEVKTHKVDLREMRLPARTRRDVEATIRKLERSR